MYCNPHRLSYQSPDCIKVLIAVVIIILLVGGLKTASSDTASPTHSHAIRAKAGNRIMRHRTSPPYFARLRCYKHIPE